MRVYIDREDDDGRFCASWERYLGDDGTYTEAGAGPYASTVVGALAELCATLLKVDEDKAVEAREAQRIPAPPDAPQEYPDRAILILGIDGLLRL